MFFFTDSNLQEAAKKMTVEESQPGSSYHLQDSDSEPDCGVDDNDELGWTDGEENFDNPLPPSCREKPPQTTVDNPLPPTCYEQPPQNIDNAMPPSCYEQPPTNVNNSSPSSFCEKPLKIPATQRKYDAAGNGSEQKKKNSRKKNVVRKPVLKKKLLPKKNKTKKIAFKPRVRIGKRVADTLIRYRIDIV